MNHGPLIFIGVFASIALSWWSLIFVPQLQIGAQRAQATDAGFYPTERPGFAAQGKQVYVSAGCVYCHSQQVHQEGFAFDVEIVEGGTNQPAVITWLEKNVPAIASDATRMVAGASSQSPQNILAKANRAEAEAAQSALSSAGAKVQVIFVPLGADMARGWGGRRSVAQDYLFDYPVQVGNSRLGPDLANVGTRLPDANWHLRHLYHPRTEVKGSIMPAYPYLFEKRKVGRQPSPDALQLPPEFAPPAGYEILPTPEALQLVAYLQSLRLDMPLLEAPMSVAPQPAAAAETNAPSGAATNAGPIAAPQP